MFRSSLNVASVVKAGFFLLASFPALSGAAIIAYNNQGDFNATLGNSPTYTENFASLPTGSNPNGAAFNAANPALSFSASAGSTPSGVTLWRNENPTPYGSWLSTSNQPSTLTFIFGSQGVSAVGGNFFITNEAEAYVAGTVSISINGGTPIVVNSVASGNQPFTGFRATGGDAITSIAITPVIPTPPTTTYYPTAANFTIAAIPEPTASFLGLLSTGLLLRRKRK